MQILYNAVLYEMLSVGGCVSQHWLVGVMEVEKPTDSGKVIKARKLKDGFTFQLSIDHIIEQVSRVYVLL